MRIASKAQAAHFYQQYKSGKIPYSELMKSVHETGDMSKLPDRVKPKGNTQTKTELAIKGLV